MQLSNHKEEIFYRVDENVTTFGMDKGTNKAISHSKDFRGDDLHHCRAKAIEYYNDRLDGLNKTKYFSPFADPLNFIMGKNAAFSICLLIIECLTDKDSGESSFGEYFLAGESEEDIAEGREFERLILDQYVERE